MTKTTSVDPAKGKDENPTVALTRNVQSINWRNRDLSIVFQLVPIPVLILIPVAILILVSVPVPVPIPQLILVLSP